MQRCLFGPIHRRDMFRERSLMHAFGVYQRRDSADNRCLRTLGQDFVPHCGHLLPQT